MKFPKVGFFNETKCICLIFYFSYLTNVSWLLYSLENRQKIKKKIWCFLEILVSFESWLDWFNKIYRSTLSEDCLWYLILRGKQKV